MTKKREVHCTQTWINLVVFEKWRKQVEVAQYKKAAEKSISTEEFLNKEIDAVIIDVAVQTDTNIRLLNVQISNLLGEPLESKIDPSNAESIIEHLNWLGIHTVSDLLTAIREHSEVALAIANEILKEYKSEDDASKASATIGLFYLCYAVLIARECTAERIYSYLTDNGIALFEEREDFAKELLSYRERFLGQAEEM